MAVRPRSRTRQTGLASWNGDQHFHCVEVFFQSGASTIPHSDPSILSSRPRAIYFSYAIPLSPALMIAAVTLRKLCFGPGNIVSGGRIQPAIFNVDVMAAVPGQFDICLRRVRSSVKLTGKCWPRHAVIKTLLHIRFS